MDQAYVIRHKVLVEGLSVRQVARQPGVSRNTVRRYLDGAEPRRTQSSRTRAAGQRARAATRRRGDLRRAPLDRREAATDGGAPA
jgi:transposase